MRELYEQFIAYARAYSDAIPTYTSVTTTRRCCTITTSVHCRYACAAIHVRVRPGSRPLESLSLRRRRTRPRHSDPQDPSRFLQAAIQLH